MKLYFVLILNVLIHQEIQQLTGNQILEQLQKENITDFDIITFTFSELSSTPKQT